MSKTAKTKFKPDNYFTDIKYNNTCTAILKTFSVLNKRLEKSAWDLKSNGVPSLVLARADHFNPAYFFCESHFGFAYTTLVPGESPDSILPLFQKVGQNIPGKELSVPKYIFLLRPEVEGELKPVDAIYYDQNSKKGREPLSIGVYKSEKKENPVRFYVFYPKIDQIGFIESLKVLENLQKSNENIGLEEAIKLHKSINQCLQTVTQKKSELKKLADSITDLLKKSKIKQDIFWDQSFGDKDAGHMKEFLQHEYNTSAIEQVDPKEADLIKEVIEKLTKFQEDRQIVAKSRSDAEKRLLKEFNLLAERVKSLTEMVEKDEKAASGGDQSKDVDDAVWNYGPETEAIWDVINEIIAVCTTMRGFSNSYKGRVRLKLMHAIQLVHDADHHLFDEVDGGGSTLIGTSKVLLEMQ